MSQEKYIGMDVHQATISVAVMDAAGKLIMECLLETKAATVVEFIGGLHGTLSLTFEEGTSAAWLHDLLKGWLRSLNQEFGRDLKNLFKSAAISASTRPRPLRDFCGSGGERDAADHGPYYLSSEDSRDQFNHLEERSELRPPTIAATSSLSISEEQAFHLCGFLRWWRSGSSDARVRG